MGVKIISGFNDGFFKRLACIVSSSMDQVNLPPYVGDAAGGRGSMRGLPFIALRLKV